MGSFSISGKYAPKDYDFIVVPFADGKTPLCNDIILPELDFQAPEKEGESLIVHSGKCGKYLRIVAKSARLDAKNSNPEKEMRKLVSAALSEAKSAKCKRVIILTSELDTPLAIAAQEGAELGGYVFDKYLKEKKKPLPAVLIAKNETKLKKAVKPAATVNKWVNFARDILNEPANVIHPESLAKLMSTEGKKAGLTVEIWNEARLKKEKCGGILGVGDGASKRPKLVSATYSPRGAVCHLALVGKGVTFDTGGYCLKPASSQVGMKMDMGGAAMMFGAACSIAQLKLPIKITLLCPLVENDISSTAYHTTDILKMRSGLTVQVDNTDAEGRLILADALDIAAGKKPDYIIDSATLTGACVVGLGEDIAGVYGTDSIFTGQFLNAGEEVGEYLWEMPLHTPYAEQLKTEIADCKNIGSRWGGSITAALFLKQFVPDGQKWIHVDIAGPGIKEDAHEHLGKGAKGFGVKSITALAGNLVEQGKVK